MIIVDVLGDGSCFYRSLFYAAVYTRNMPKLLRRLYGSRTRIPDVEWTEDTFVKEVRNILSKYMRNEIAFPRKRATRILNDIYTHLRELSENDRVIFREVLNAFPSWFVKHFRKFPETYEEFANKMGKYSRKTKNWVSEIEIRILQAILYDVPMRIFNSPPTRETLNCETIYLLNLGEAHYNYILCRDCRPKIVNPKTRRCVKPEGAIGRRIVEKYIK